MKKQDDKPLFTVSNHHAGNCGKPPGINGDRPDCYHGYLENALGEQFVFVYYRGTGKAELMCMLKHSSHFPNPPRRYPVRL